MAKLVRRIPVEVKQARRCTPIDGRYLVDLTSDIDDDAFATPDFEATVVMTAEELAELLAFEGAATVKVVVG